MCELEFSCVVQCVLNEYEKRTGGEVMNKKQIRFRFFVLSFLLALVIPVISFAGQEHRSAKPNQVVSSNEQRKKEQAHLDRLAKLEHDMKIFETVGSENISPDNIFYPIRKSGLTEEELESSFRGTDMQGTAKAFIEVENQYGVNALFLAAIANHESFYGASNIAKQKNNLFGFNANDENPYNLASDYQSYEDCILKVGKKIKENYLRTDGQYFNGFSAEGMNTNYSSDRSWAKKVNYHMLQIAQKILTDTTNLYADR